MEEVPPNKSSRRTSESKTMSLIKVIECDGEGCGRRIKVSPYPAYVARESLRNPGGWTGSHGKDYCPDCRRKKESEGRDATLPVS